MKSEYASLLSADGPLAEAIPGFKAREEQQALAIAVGETIDGHAKLIAEAGTGTGKTFAYLAPAIASGQRVLVSTGTKNLQDQLFNKDLPVVRSALGMPVKTALLKGRANYLCLERMSNAIKDEAWAGPERRLLNGIEEWSQQTVSGDLAEYSALPEDARLRPAITSTTDNCLGAECPQYEDCHVLRARQQALKADLVVVNHYLLFADMSLKEDGFGELLPGAGAVIVDEAHQLPEIAGQFFGQSISTRQFRELAREVKLVQRQHAADVPELLEAAESVDKQVQDTRLSLGEGMQRLPWRQIANRPDVQDAFGRLQSELTRLEQYLSKMADRHRAIETASKRADAYLTRLNSLLDTTEGEQIRWLETYARSFVLHATPLDVAPLVGRWLKNDKTAWIFTSATLAVNGGFEHFADRLGIEDAQTMLAGSPFDYQNNSLLYAPKGLPAPNSQDFVREVIRAADPLINACPGGIFLLFTSHRALREAAAILERQADRLVLAQGSAPRGELVERFRADGHAILLGAASFWEGVDVQGDALQLVVIDKFPFAAPNDPVMQARLEAMRKSGGEPFFDYQVPQAVIALKQGAGRLIRGENDRGVLMVCDPRLYSKGYGKQFLNSLPPMRQTRDINEALAFWGAA